MLRSLSHKPAVPDRAARAFGAGRESAGGGRAPRPVFSSFVLRFARSAPLLDTIETASIFFLIEKRIFFIFYLLIFRLGREISK